MKSKYRNFLKLLVLPTLLAFVSPAFSEDQGQAFYIWSCAGHDNYEYAKGRFGNISFEIQPDNWVGSYDTSLTPGNRAEKFEIFWFTRSKNKVSQSTNGSVTKLASKGLDIVINTGKQCNSSEYSVNGVWFEAEASVDPKMSKFPVRVGDGQIGNPVVVQKQRVCCHEYEQPGESDWGVAPHWY